ncbi:hypothetical protein [Stenotrophomonas sp. SAU14A_NAIMI4_5]|uniref:hypothetical protein n=1 Tax=Stenotrophomonas sp. SAU14A_NAIMI4_5 TaxID=2072413 RepID=UPI00131EE8AB|nr:hypothetical protein [Stenotrophomonas sp. SAU14A_NAIMI4_5]
MAFLVLERAARADLTARTGRLHPKAKENQMIRAGARNQPHILRLLEKNQASWEVDAQQRRYR